MPIDPPIRESGRVLRREGPVAVVEIRRAAACAGCAASGACSAMGGGSDRRELRAQNPVDAVAGDWVEVEIPAARALSAAAWVYLLPTVVLLLAALAGHAAAARVGLGHRADMIAAMAALGALALVVLLALLRARRSPPRTARLPVVVKRRSAAAAEAASPDAPAAPDREG